VHRRPSGAVQDEIISITRDLTSIWFMKNVPDDTSRDLGFQDVMILKEAGRIISFIMYTCIDGTLQISLMGTRPESMRKGFGSLLMKEFCEHIREMGFNRIMVYTVPPDKKPAYASTLSFYLNQGFRILRRYDELWESGAVQLVRELAGAAGPGEHEECAAVHQDTRSEPVSR
jgi:ribosomal protein S18 acetylase RimI-like enzyme